MGNTLWHVDETLAAFSFQDSGILLLLLMVLTTLITFRSDLIPELHKEVETKKSIISFVLFLIGIFFLLVIKMVGA